MNLLLIEVARRCVFCFHSSLGRGLKVFGRAVLFALLLGVPGSALSQRSLQRYEDRATQYTRGQPNWVGPVITTVPMLSQVFRQDVQRTLLPGGDAAWNIGAAKGLQFVPLPHMEFTISTLPYIARGTGGSSGVGDMSVAAKFRVAAADAAHGNYIFTTVLTASLPTGSGRNGQGTATVTPQFIAGKGWGKFDVVGAFSGTLPTGNAATAGRAITGNAVAQYHLLQYLWPQVESNTNAFFGGTRDGQVQSFVTPGAVLGRLPYTRHEVDRRRGVSVGVAMQFAVTHQHAYDHNLVITTRLHF